MTNHFDSSVDFLTTYQEILDIPGIPEANDKTYQLSQFYSGRFVVFQRQRTDSYFVVNELEIITDMNA